MKKLIKSIVSISMIVSSLSFADSQHLTADKLDVNGILHQGTPNVKLDNSIYRKSMDLKSINSVRIIAKDPIKLSEKFKNKLGFKTWFLGDLPGGEKVVMVLLPSGQSLEIVSQHPSYSTVSVNSAKSLTLGIEVDEIQETKKFLKESGMPLFPIIPVHVAGNEKKPKMFELLFLGSQLYPYNSLHYVKKFYGNIEKIRETYPNLDDRPWRNHNNGVVGIREVWMATSSIKREKSHLLPLGLLNDTTLQEKGILVYNLGDTLFKLVSPEYKPLSDIVAKRLGDYGPGIFRIKFDVEKDVDSTHTLTDKYGWTSPFSLPGMDTVLVFETTKGIVDTVAVSE